VSKPETDRKSVSMSMSTKVPTILVVEDESIVAMDMERRLRGLGYEVAGRVLTGPDAVTQTSQLKPDVVLMDIHLKGKMDGIEAAGLIKREYDVPVIYITAYSDQATLERAKETEPYGYILKPFQEREIHSVIEMALYKHQAEGELKRAKQEAEEGLRARNEFLSNMSHEFRTPLNAILGMASLAKETADNPELQEYLDLITDSGRSLLDMVNAVLDYSRFMDDTALPGESCLITEELVSDLKKRFDYQAGQRNIALTIEVAEDLPTSLRCDGEKYRQIIVHLLSNALKFTSEGTVALKISVAEPVDHTGGMAKIIVTDTGIGIEKVQQELIFREFTQVDSSATRTYGGTGLGLALVKRFVEQSGGSITLTSEIGEGSCFEVLLPVRKGSDDSCAGKAYQLQLGGTQQAAVYPDNMGDFIRFCREMLEKGSYEQIENGAEAVKLHLNRSGYGNNRDNLLRVILGARKKSKVKTSAALDLLENELKNESERG
jgi:signal transduction histidine kinase